MVSFLVFSSQSLRISINFVFNTSFPAEANTLENISNSPPKKYFNCQIKSLNIVFHNDLPFGLNKQPPASSIMIFPAATSQHFKPSVKYPSNAPEAT